MNLAKKKLLAARTLNVGVGRLLFNSSRIDEIKEAITKQDIRDLHASGAIVIKLVKGRKTIEKRKTRRRGGSIRHKKSLTKQDYVKTTRKLRSFLKSLLKKNQLSRENFLLLRQEIRASAFKNVSAIKERISKLK